MRKTFWPRCRRAAVTMTAVLAVSISGCAQVSEWLGGDSAEVIEPVYIGGKDPLHYIEEMSRLASSDPVTQAEIYADAAAAARVTPDTGARLRFALVLALPGHGGSDPQLARDLLRELLAEAELLTPVESSIATVHLNEVEARLLLNAEARRLRLASSRAANTEEAAAAQRLAAVETENRQLRQSLAEAEQKLEAITSIERSIRQQSNNDNDQHNGQR